MSIKAGRVGVAPDQVDLFGNIIGGGGSGGDAYTKAESDAKFETITNAASTYETKANAASTYETKTNAASTYETKANAADTYETKANAASTYETKANAADTYETKANAASTYETKANAADTYETKANAASTYETKTHAADTYVTSSAVAGLQSETLDTPISMLSGNKTTVESALQGLNESNASLITLTTGNASKITLLSTRTAVQGKVCFVQCQVHVTSGYSQSSSIQNAVIISGVPVNSIKGASCMVDTAGKSIPLQILSSGDDIVASFVNIAVPAATYNFTYTWIC